MRGTKYYVYMVLKWTFAAFAIVSLLIGATQAEGNPLLYYQQSIACGVLAIFFELQQDSNKPSEEELELERKTSEEWMAENFPEREERRPRPPR